MASYACAENAFKAYQAFNAENAVNAGQAVNAANAEGTIQGPSILGIDQTVSYTLSGAANDVAVQWQAPIGCRIVEGQGTPTIKMVSTYMAQDSQLQAAYLVDGKEVTEKIDVSFVRTIKSFKDYSANYGGSVTINGVDYAEPQIVYTDAGETQGVKQVEAHRISIVAPLVGQEMTVPYLQTPTEDGIWVTWKTNFENAPVVMFGLTPETMDQEVKGETNSLSASYYWNSVHLTELQPNTVYYYKVKSGEKESATYRFRTMPKRGEKTPMRILLMGDHQVRSRSGYEWLSNAALAKIQEKYGDVVENINMVMNLGDQVDVGTLDQYENMHLYKSRILSPNLPIMGAVGNHETYSDPGMKTYAAHYHYEDLAYMGITSGTENYYAYQAGRILFVVLSTEHTGTPQREWLQKVVDAAKTDDTVDFIISVNHRPIQAEQYIGDISAWVRDVAVPILSQTEKHVFNYGGHHHLYHRGQFTDYPFYHIINGAASWDQMWGMSSEKDYGDVQKTIDYWAYQILDFDFENKEMKAECYAIGNKELVVDNILIDTFHRKMGLEAPAQPTVNEVNKQGIVLPYTFSSSAYESQSGNPLNTVEYQFSNMPDFSVVSYQVLRDVEDLYGSTKAPLYLPIDVNERVDITKCTVEGGVLQNGTNYVRVRYRDNNLEWSDWSDPMSFKVSGSIDGAPALIMPKDNYAMGEEISISYQNASIEEGAWLGVFHKGQTPGVDSPICKQLMNGLPAGTVTVREITETDEYFVALFKNEGTEEVASRLSFYVGTTPLLASDKESYKEGETVKISFSKAPALESDWIGIYKMGRTPGTADLAAQYVYTKSENGEVSFENLPKGYYFAAYFTRGGYLEVGERIKFSVGETISTVSAAEEFSSMEDIKIDYKDGPGTPKDWVGFFLEGKDVNVDELDGFFYTYGATDGTITVPAGTLAPGRYFVALYINDSYTAVSNTIYVTIKNDRPSLEINKTKFEEGEEIVVTYKNESKDENAWIGVYQDWQTPGQDGVSTSWEYLRDLKDNTFKFSKTESGSDLKAGKYYVVMLKDGGYTECSERVYFTVTGQIDPDAVITTLQGLYKSGEDVTLNFVSPSTDSKAWIGVYKEGDTPGALCPSKVWAYVKDLDGMFVFNADKDGKPLAEGTYYAVLFKDSGYKEYSQRTKFRIKEAAELATISLNNPSYKAGETIEATIFGGSSAEGAWIAIYKKGEVPGTADIYSTKWSYLADLSNNVWKTSLSEEGEYYAVLFYDGGYLEDSKRVYFTVSNVTGLPETSVDPLAVTCQRGAILVKAAQDAFLTVNSLDGCTTRRYQIKTGQTRILLPAGIYIINGKKFVVM